jgi:putative transposase
VTFWYCYYHVVWATYLRSPLLSSNLEALVHTWVRDKSAAMQAEVLAVNGMPDHVHICVSIPPKLSPADWVNNIKGYTAHEANGRFPNTPERFRWQSGYGVLTISPRHLEYVVNYVNRQKQHHADSKLNPNFERMSDED